MTEFWLVWGDPGDVAEGCELHTVEHASTWPDAKRRYRELASSCLVRVFDHDGELMRASDEVRASWEMEIPRRAGVYRWSESEGYELVGAPPRAGWRMTPGSYNSQRRGVPVNRSGGF